MPYSVIKKTQKKSIWSSTAVHVALPVALTVVLFIGSFYGFILPSLKTELMNGKREMIDEMTTAVLDLFWQYHLRVEHGELSLPEAQRRVRARVRVMRYGDEHKDYFWINDLEPKMIMHPYRTDLEGKNVDAFTDSKGKYLFREFIAAVEDDGEGFVDYMWQWKDDETRIVPKVSCVKLFEPWGWIVGTGIYVEDVQAHIGFMGYRLTKMFTVIFIVLILISAYIINRGMHAEKQRLSAEGERNDLMAELIEKNHDLEEYFYIISHDLKAPLVSIKGFIRMLFESLAEVCAGLHDTEKDLVHTKKLIEEDIRKPLEFISFSANKLEGLLEGLMKIARLERDRIEIETVDMNKVVADIKDGFEYQIKTGTVDLTIEDLPACRADRLYVAQVFSNVIDNALKYLSPDRPGKVRVYGWPEKKNVVYAVEDNGMGIAPEQKEKVFEMFHRLAPKVAEGQGVGMTLSKKILKRCKGSIWFDSQPNKGTTFYISLPATIAHHT